MTTHGRNRWRTALSLLLVALVLASGCGDDDADDGATDDTTATTTASKERLAGLEPGDPLKVGLILTTSGPQGVIGNIQLRGVKLAVEEINEAGGVAGHLIELVQRDDGANPTTAVSLARELVERDKVRFIIGTTLSSSALAVGEYLNQAEIPMIGSQSADEVANPQKYPFLFSGSPLTSVQAATVVEKSLEAFSPADIGIVAEATAFGDGFVKGFETTLRRVAFKGKVLVERYPQGAPDVTPQLEALRRGGAEVVFAASLGADIVRIVRTTSGMGWDAPIVGPAGSLAETVKGAGGPAAVRNLYAFTSRKHTYPEGGEPDLAAVEYRDKLKQTLGQDPLETALGQDSAFYDMVYLMATAFEDAGSVDGEKVRDALETVRYSGSYAEWKMQPDRHVSITVADQALIRADSFRDGFFQRIGD